MLYVKKGSEKEKLSAEQDIQKFKDKFLLKYKVSLFVQMRTITPAFKVVQTIEKEKLPKISLLDLEVLVNDILNMNFHNKYPQGIRGKCKSNDLIIYRGCFYKIAREMGYTFIKLGIYLGFHHATIMNSLKSINNLVVTNDEFTLININIIYEELKKRHGIEATV